MDKPVLVTTPASLSVKAFPILIIDKKGEIGFSLAEALKFSFLPLVVSSASPQKEMGLVHIPYQKSFPRLPNNTFSHIIIVFNGEKDIVAKLPKLLKKAEEHNSKVVFITSMYDASEPLLKKITGYQPLSVLVYGELFGAKQYSSPVADLLKNAKERKQIALAQTGLLTRYPLAFVDLISIILTTVLTPTQGTYFVSSPQRTELSLTRVVQQIEPAIRVDFSNEVKKQLPSFIPPGAVRLHPNQTSLEQRLREYLMIPLAHSYKPTEVIRARRISLKLRRFFTGLIIVIALPLILITLGTGIGFGSVGLSAYMLEKGYLIPSKYMATIGTFAFRVVEPSEGLFLSFSRLSGMPYPSHPYFTSVSSGKTAAELLLSASTAISDIDQALHGQGEISSDELRRSLKKAALAFQELQALEVFPAPYRQRLDESQRSISLITNLADVAPQLLGVDRSKKYVLLLQNNLELRAGGGFIEAVAPFSIDKTQIKELKIIDVYDADAKLKGHLNPPYPLQRFLGTAHWYLRDSNFSMDTSINATAAAKFLELEGVGKVDGVITIDLSFLRALLSLTGPLELPEYQTTVTEENMYKQIESHVLTLPTTSQKESFIVYLAKTIMQEILQNPPPPLEFANMVTTAIYQKHFLMTSLDKGIQPVLAQNHFVSSPALSKTADLFGVVENNVGANKANYYIKRTIQHQIRLNETGTASESVNLTYTNTSNGERLGGEYSSYVQVVVPQNTILNGITINGTAQVIVPAVVDPKEFTNSLFRAPRGLEVQTEDSLGKRIFGFLIRVKEGEERKVTITYTIPEAFEPEEQVISYNLSYLKQPGIDQDEYSLELFYPRQFQPTQAPFRTVKSAGKLQFEDSIKEDVRLEFVFLRR